MGRIAEATAEDNVLWGIKTPEPEEHQLLASESQCCKTVSLD